MRWAWRRQARPVERRRAVSGKAMELQAAKEILAEVFHARPGEVEEMTRRRLEERSWRSAGKGGSRRRSAWGSSCGAEI